MRSIRKNHIQLHENEVLFYFIHKFDGDKFTSIIANPDKLMNQLYEEHKSDDLLLYISYSKESTLG